MSNRPVLVYFNPHSTKFREFKISFLNIILFTVLIIIALVFFVKYTIDFVIDFSRNSEISQLREENAVLHSQIQQFQEKLLNMRKRLTELEQIDDRLRTMLNLPVLTEDVRKVGVGGTEEIDVSANIGVNKSSVNQTLMEDIGLLEKLEREIKLERQSYQKLLTIVERREDSLRFLPVLRPVPNSRITDGFGNRLHPILKKIRFHKGVDLAAPAGTPIIAPADGYVTFAGRNGGFGKFVQINHKYGFETYYGHLHKIYVRPGQFVKRGDKIGEVGNTGLSTNPHLHYEVHYKGKAINPINYFLPD